MSAKRSQSLGGGLSRILIDFPNLYANNYLARGAHALRAEIEFDDSKLLEPDPVDTGGGKQNEV